jgi:hypothetical protein
VRLAFGPLGYDLGGCDAARAAVAAAWRAFADVDSGSAPVARRRVDVRPGVPPDFVARAPPEVLASSPRVPRVVVVGQRFRTTRHDDHDAIALDARADASPALLRGALGEALGALVVLDAEAHGAVVVHAAGVWAGGGVVLVVAPSGTGKSTLARAAGPRVFTYNAALVVPGPAPRAWPLPFAGKPDPSLVASRAAEIVGVAVFQRADVPFIESCPGSRATTEMLRAVVRLRGAVPDANTRACRALAWAGCAPRARLGSPPDGRYLVKVDQFLAGL